MEGVTIDEIKERVERFQRHIRKLSISGAVILQNVDRFYFSGTIQSSTLFIPSEGEPIVFVHKGFARAKQESPLENIVMARPKDVKKIITEYGIKTDSIGMELDVIPVSVYFKYKKIFSGSHIVDISEAIKKTRMVKSFYEIQQIKKATQILDENLYEVQYILKPNIKEIEVDAYLGYLLRKKGHMGMMRMRAWNQEMMYVHVLSGKTGAMISFLDSPQGGKGTCPAMAQGASFKALQRNEPIEIDHGACINGYMADEARTFVIGRLSDDLRKAHGCSMEIHNLFFQNAKPGVYCHELYAMALETVKSWGLEEYFMGYKEGKVKFIGHGVGLEIDEYPVIGPHFKEPLQENMVIAFEPKFIFPDKGVVGLEDMYLIKASEAERITQIEQRVFEIKR